jgi:hypothetical protein
LTRGRDALATALIIGGTGGAFAAFGSPELLITSPGPLALVLLAGVLVLCRPTFGPSAMRPVQRVALGAAVVGILLPLMGSLGLAIEAEAAMVAAPRWLFAVGALLVGLALARRSLEVFAAVLIIIGGLRTWGAWQSGLDWGGEIVWWGPVVAWLIGAVMLSHRPARVVLPDSTALLGAVAWFLLAVIAMTLQESRHPTPHFFAPDRDALFGAVAAQPALGWGLGSSERVFLEFSRRDPDLAPIAVRSLLRLATEVGLIALLLLFAAGLIVTAHGLKQQTWSTRRLAALGVAGFFLLAVISSRGEWSALLALFALAFGSAFAGEEKSPGPAWTLTMVGAVPLLAVAALLFSAQAHYLAQNPRENVEARSFLPMWTLPLRNEAFLLRQRLEITPGDEPSVERLVALASQWTAVSPHDEYGWIERVRVLNARLGPGEAVETSREASRRLPWSNALAAWHRRLLVENDRQREAIQFLEELRVRRGTLPPALAGRLLELRIQRREVEDRGHRD